MNVIKQQLINKKYKPLVDNIDRYFMESNVVLQDDRNMIKVIDFNNESLVIKSYKKPSFFIGFIYTFVQKSKAWRAYEYGLRISEFTPGVIARIEYLNPLLSKSYLICEKFEAEFNLQKPLFYNHPDKEAIFSQFAEFVYELHQQDIFHKDLSPGNILIKKSGEKYQFKIIDINRMSFKKLSKRQRAENFNKLWAHDSDLELMLKVYAKSAQFDEESFVRLGLEFNQKNKDRKTRKRKIKQALGLW
jgi:serine/threonine protein kinase